MSEEDLNTYKKYVSDLDITKYIVLDSESNYWYSAEYVDEMLKKQDKEIERLNNIINELEEYIEDRISVLTINVDNKTKDEYFNNKCIGGVQELKNVKSILPKEVNKE